MPIFADRDPRGKLTGRWRAQVRVEGVNYKSPRFDTFEEARAWETKARGDEEFTKLKKRDVVDVITYGDLYSKGSGVIWRGQDSETTSELRFRLLVKHIGAETRLTDITTERIDDLVADLIRTRQGSTVNRYLSILRTSLNWAMERKYIRELPVFDWQDEDNGRIRWISNEEERRLYELLDPHIASLVRVAIATGMRRGEILSLKFDQVKPTKVHLWKTKNKQSRTVQITPDTYQRLVMLLEEGMPSESQLRHAWDKARKAMGLMDDPYFVFHVCRHTCCTRLVEANVNLRVIQSWMGHKRIETTMRYAQIKDSMMEDALTKLTDFEHTQVDADWAQVIPMPKTVGLFGITKNLVDKKAQRNQCGRGGTGRRAGFRSSGNTEETEE